MTTLEQILQQTRTGHALFMGNNSTGEDHSIYAETRGERGKLIKDATLFAQRYSRFLTNQGIGILSHLGYSKKNFKNKFKGVGSVRFTPNGGRIVAATFINYGVIVSNSYGGGMSEGIDDIARETELDNSEMREYMFTEETVHLMNRKWSESSVALSMFQYYMKRANATHDPDARRRYQRLAGVAKQRYHVHAKIEEKYVSSGEKKNLRNKKTKGKKKQNKGEKAA
jgi:hypothetical protein